VTNAKKSCCHPGFLSPSFAFDHKKYIFVKVKEFIVNFVQSRGDHFGLDFGAEFASRDLFLKITLTTYWEVAVAVKEKLNICEQLWMLRRILFQAQSIRDSGIQSHFWKLLHCLSIMIVLFRVTESS